MAKEIITIIYSCSHCPYLESKPKDFQSETHLKIDFYCRLTGKLLATQISLIKKDPPISLAGDMAKDVHLTCPLPDRKVSPKTDEHSLPSAPTEAFLDIPRELLDGYKDKL